jgi:hypothetical protein
LVLRARQVLLAYPDLEVTQESLVRREEEETLVYPDQKVPRASKEKEDHRELEGLKDLLEKPETMEIRVRQVQPESLEHWA